MDYQDTYFLDFNEAYKVASQHNKNDFHHLQVCYYNGVKIDTGLVNLIHLPADNIANTLGYGTLRIPTNLDMNGTNYSDLQRQELFKLINQEIEGAMNIREQENSKYYDIMFKTVPNFNEPLRLYLKGHKNTTVVQYTAKNLADALTNLGYDVKFDYLYGMEDIQSGKSLAEYNPHVTININHLQNDFLHPDRFNFVWIQDYNPVIRDLDKNKLRKRDFIFTLMNHLDKFISPDNLIKIYNQSFCYAQDKFKVNPDIKREKKIVFIGSSYVNDFRKDKQNLEAVDYILQMFINGETFSEDVVEEIASRFNLDKYFVETKLIIYVVRDYSVLYLANLDTEYEVEIYGKGWEYYNNENLKKYLKGPLNYGQELADVYSGATYALCPHNIHILQQRIFEAASCGAIPIAYDCRELTSDKPYNEAIEYYKTIEDLEKILQNDPLKKNFANLLDEHKYENFAKRIVQIVEENVR